MHKKANEKPGIVSKTNCCQLKASQPASDFPIDYPSFEYKCNWLIISRIEQLHHMFNEEEY